MAAQFGIGHISDLRQRDLEVCPEDLDWSPAGDQIGVCGAVFNLENGARCADGGTCFATRSGGRPPHPVPEGLLVRMDSPRDQADRYRKTILDSHTNHKIASWAVEDAGWRNSFEIIRRPAPSEIAPSGDLIAEATNQVIRLYRLKR
jgi:hypothetical protein